MFIIQLCFKPLTKHANPKPSYQLMSNWRDIILMVVIYD